MIKKITVYMLAVMFLSSSLYADGFSRIATENGFRDFDEIALKIKEKEKDEVQVMWDGKVIGTYTKEQFIEILNAAEITNKLTIAEKNSKVFVVLKENPWKVKLGSKFESSMQIIWKDENNQTLKTISIDMTLQTTPDGKAWLIYKDISAVMFPVMTLVVLILLLVIFIK
jgi:hypothetical protein